MLCDPYQNPERWTGIMNLARAARSYEICPTFLIGCRDEQGSCLVVVKSGVWPRLAFGGDDVVVAQP